MIGCISVASAAGETISKVPRTHSPLIFCNNPNSQDDQELEDARWFDVSEGSSRSPHHLNWHFHLLAVAEAVHLSLASQASDPWTAPPDAKFTLPPQFAIAFQLLKVRMALRRQSSRPPSPIVTRGMHLELHLQAACEGWEPPEVASKSVSSL
jgi:hypothetical protein